MKIRPAVTTATAALGLLAAAFATTTAGAAASPPGSHHKIQRLVVLQPRYDEGVRPNLSRSGASKTSAPSIPLFHSTVTALVDKLQACDRRCHDVSVHHGR